MDVSWLCAQYSICSWLHAQAERRDLIIAHVEVHTAYGA